MEEKKWWFWRKVIFFNEVEMIERRMRGKENVKSEVKMDMSKVK